MVQHGLNSIIFQSLTNLSQEACEHRPKYIISLIGSNLNFILIALGYNELMLCITLLFLCKLQQD